MTRTQKYAGVSMTVLSGIAVYCFFALKYPYHLHFQEQYQLFEFTGRYFRELVAVPGGLADWVGRFLIQFFYYAPAGAAILALLFCAMQLLTWSVCRQRSLPVFALSFLPSFAFLLFCCDENALPGGGVALLLALGAAALCARIRADMPRHVFEAALVPVLYWVCGPLAVVSVLVSLIGEFVRCGRRAVVPAVVMVAMATVCPILASRLAPYPLVRMFSGIHYYRYPNVLPGFLWIAALCAVSVALASCARWNSRNGTLQGVLVFVAMTALGVFLTFRAADPSKEEEMRYDFMVRMEMWNRIMMTADRHNPDTPKGVSCLNLALGMSGRMPDSQFSYTQIGPEGLLPGFVLDYTNPLSTAEIFWHLGMVNTAQRYTFEAQEAIPDFQKSARCYRRLAETNIVNGDEGVARKYLAALTHTLFYRRWARETLLSLDAGDIFDRRPELARVRALRFKEHDFLFSDTEMDSMLGLLKVENPDNTMALDYLMAWCLLRKDLDRFVQCIGMVEAPVMPKAYQEALLLRWVQTHSDFTGLPTYLAPVHAQRISRFLADMQSGQPEAEMRRAYGDSYWYYYFFYDLP